MAVDFNPCLYGGWPDALRKLASKVRKENMADADAHEIELAAGVLEKALEFAFAVRPLVRKQERRARELKHFVDKAPDTYKRASGAAFSTEDEIFPTLSEGEISEILQRFDTMSKKEAQKPPSVPFPPPLRRVFPSQPTQQAQARDDRGYDASRVSFGELRRGLSTEEGKVSHKLEMMSRELERVSKSLAVVVEMLGESRGLH